MATPHLVILVHGIRDIARWQGEVGRALETEGLIVEHTSYGRWNLVLFLLPFDFVRRIAMKRVWTDIQHARMLHPQAEVSIIAHSFGTFVVTRILKAEFALQLKRLILCGSIVRYDFPFEQIQNRFVPPLINDVGTADPWPAIAEALTTGYGSAGTFGFNRPGVEDRYHNGRGHGHFLNGAFATKYWAPFLKDGTVVPGDEPAKDPPLWVRLISIFKIKYLLLTLIVFVAAFFALRVAYGSAPVSMRQMGVFYWGAMQRIVDRAGEPCPLPDFVCGNPIGEMALERRYTRNTVTGGSLGEIASCGEFRFPPPDEGVSRDPVAAVLHLGATYPQCVSTTLDARRNLTVTLHKDRMTEVAPRRGDRPRTMWLCNCDAAFAAQFEAEN